MVKFNAIPNQLNSLKFISLTTAALATVMLSTPAHAQSSEASFEDEVIVTARRKSESLQDVPGSVTAITAATIEKAAIQRADDFLRLTPGVTLVNTAEVGDTQVNIRGINGARDAENSFAFLIDGVLYTNPAAFNREYTDLQQIEVFKGPQGAIYGRNAAAGAIIVTTDKPDNDYGANVTASFAEDNTFLLKGGISGPLIEDQLYFGLSADFRTTDGFFRNSFQNDDPIVDALNSFNFNTRLVYEPNDALSVDIKARYGEVNASSIAFNSTFSLPVFAEITGTPSADLDVNDQEFLFQGNIVPDNDQEAFEISGKFDYDLGATTLTGWALYSDISNNLIADGTSAAFGFFDNDPACQQSVADFNAAGFPLPPPTFFGEIPNGVIFAPNGSFLGAFTPSTCDGIQEQVRDQTDFSAELRLASNSNGPLSWSVGGYFLDIDRQVGVSLNRDSGNVPIRGLFQESGPNQTVSLLFDDFDSTVLAVFGEASYDVTDDVELSVALRFDSEERQVSSLVPNDVTQGFIDLNFDGVFDDPLNPGLSPIVNPDGVIEDQEETFTQFQPKVSGSWDINDNTTLFASWGVGFKAGGFNNSGSAATVNIFNNALISGGVPAISDIAFNEVIGSDLPVIQDTFGEETSSAFEVGFKTSFWDNRVKLSGAGYLTNVDDLQFFEFFVGTFGLLRVVSNVDEVRIIGFEIGADAAITDDLNIYGGFNFTDSEIQANSSRPDTVGNESPLTPDFTINGGGDYTFNLTDEFDLVLRADAQVTGPTNFQTVQSGDQATIFNPLFQAGAGFGALGTANFENAERDTFFTVDLRATVQNEYWALSVFADNVTDEAILEEVIPAIEFGGNFLAPGRQRRFGGEVSFKF